MIADQDLSSSRVSQVIDKQESEEIQKAEDILKFYVDNYPEVFVLICDGCRTKLAIEYLDIAKPNPNHLNGRTVISISEKFKSYRPRFDGAMGYQCKCGNNTKLATIEDGIIPVAKIVNGVMQMPTGGMEIHPHHIQAVKDRIAQLNYTPEIRLKGKDMIIETFRLRRLK